MPQPYDALPILHITAIKYLITRSLTYATH